MTLSRRTVLAAMAASATAFTAAAPLPAFSEEAQVIDARVNIAFGKLYKQVPGARELAQNAKAILMMPEVLKGGFIVGASYGEGALRLNQGGGRYDKTVQYYSVGAGSVGFQAGLQRTSHALFFLTDGALDNFRKKDGWAVGADAEVTFPSAGLNAGLATTTANRPIIGVVFGEDGLLIGASLNGAKYTRIDR